MYRALDPEMIIGTVATLEERIGERFPEAGLRKVARELIGVAQAAQSRIADITRPNIGLRIASGLVIAAGVALLATVVARLKIEGASTELFGMMQGIEAAVNLAIVVGAAVLFLVTLESRLKRAAALRHLHELRAIIHVIDMHQLTKDPSVVIEGGPATAHSPQRTMTPFELTRYLDYCSELLSLTAKVAALYVQSSTDVQVIDAVNDIERLTTSLSSKIWQKITLVQSARLGEAAATRAPAAEVGRGG